MNKVIIIGDDHSNTLGVIRAFGENGIKPYVFIISNTKFISLKKSKYINKFWICKDEEEAILTILSEFNDDDNIVIIPTSDTAASIIDCNYDRLSNKFIIQNIDQTSNLINKYMDKFEQYKIAQKYDIKMAKSQIVIFPFQFSKINNDFQYPLIVKPLLSIDGKKEDIRIAYNKEDIENIFCFYNDNNYKRILVQELIDFDYECDMSGFCYQKEVSIAGYIQKERIWPLKRGSLTFGKVKKYSTLKESLDKIKKVLQDLNYSGMFDIEFFVKGNDVYLNEINFRNSGLTYLYGESYLCYYYYLSCVNSKFMVAPEVEEEYYIMDEQAEIHQIIDGNISLKKHFEDKKKSKMLLVKNKKDIKPGRYLFIYKLLNNLKLNKMLMLFEKGIHKSKDYYLLYADELSLKKEKINDDYEIVEINKNNLELLSDKEENMNGYMNAFKKENIHGIVLKKDNEIMARGIIKTKGAEDRFVNIKNEHSYLLCNLYVNPKYRGKNYQCDVSMLLIEKYVKEDKYKLYTIVYKYNLPSWKNFIKIGFKIVKTSQLIRFLKKSINKEVI